MFSRRHWIPPGGLLLAHVAHGLSWMLLLWIAVNGTINGVSGPGLAWIHLVALGWFTVAALSVLLHVIPGFTELQWRLEGVARVSLGVFVVGVAALVVSLFAAQRLAEVPAAVTVIALLCYVTAAWATLAQARQLARTERAIARALSIVLVMLVTVAILGLLLAFFLSGAVAGTWIARLPAAHASLAFYGWLSLLVYGVSARTVRPICGVTSRFTWIHIVVGTSTLIGAPVLAAGLALGNAAAMWLGAALLGLGALAYAADITDILTHATTPHRPPQAFIAASVVWLVTGTTLGASVLAGSSLVFAYGFVVLVGWVGQMVNAHMHHLATRVIATVYRGDDDDTRPQALLDIRLSWTSFTLFQIAVGFASYGLALALGWAVVAGALAGITAWIVMSLNLAYAQVRARSPSLISLGGM